MRLPGILALALLGSPPFLLLQAASRQPVRAKHAMVASTDRLASQVGIDILRKRGNAIDAAVAVGFALAVTHPSAGNLGGGGFMMIRFANGETACIDYRETAPLAAGRNTYLDSSGNLIPRATTEGYRASGVPGTPAGLCLAQRKYGRLRLKDVIQPAIDLAENGFPVSDHLSQSLEDGAKRLSQFPESLRVFLRDGKFLEPGETLIQKELAWSLRVIRDLGSEGFYRGPVADKIVSMYREHGNWISAKDLETYEARFRTPLRGRYRDYEVITMPPPSSGGTVLLEMLNILEGYDLARMGAGSSQSIHLMAEAMRLAFRDRAQLMGDADYVSVPVAKLISKSYAALLRAQIDLDKAARSELLPARVFPTHESTQTAHYSVVDADGNAVANTYTLNGSYGSGVTVEGAGILMNNEMDDFTSNPGGSSSNTYGLIQAEANAIAPGKRPLSSMTPTFLTRDNQLILVIGSPGGPTIINTVLQVIVNMIDFGFTIQEAIDAPRFHHQWLPDELQLERRGFVRDTLEALERRGHRIAFRGFMGDAEGIHVDPETRMRLGASDPREDGVTLGY